MIVKGYDKFDHDNKVIKFTNYCDNVLDLKNAKLGKEYHYNSITSCVIDAVFSIGISYQQTQKVVERYNEYFKLKEFRNGDDFPPINNQDSLDNLINKTKKITPEIMANKIYKNRCRTDTHKSSILKSEAVLLFSMALKSFGINYLQNVKKYIGNEELEKKIKKIRGQSSGISLDYFFMLAGDNDYIKADRMMLRFFKDAINEIPNKYSIQKIMIDATNILKNKYPQLTPKMLDHQLWLYQREKK